MISRSKSRTKRKVDDIGRVVVDVELANHEDIILADAGMLPLEEVRRMTFSGVIDTGATRLVLPHQVVKELGLRVSGETVVRYADHRAARRKVAPYVQLKLLGRESVFSAVIEPRRKDALIGAIVLEELDLLVDCNRQRLVPRDPARIISEIE